MCRLGLQKYPPYRPTLLSQQLGQPICRLKHPAKKCHGNRGARLWALKLQKEDSTRKRKCRSGMIPLAFNPLSTYVSKRQNSESSFFSLRCCVHSKTTPISCTYMVPFLWTWLRDTLYRNTAYFIITIGRSRELVAYLGDLFTCRPILCKDVPGWPDLLRICRWRSW